MDILLGSLDGYTGSDPTSLLATEAYLAATRDETLRIELIGLVELVNPGAAVNKNAQRKNRQRED